VGQVSRWITTIITKPRFRVVRRDWLDLHQDILRRVVESLRTERFDDSQDFRAYIQGIAWYTARDAVVRRLRTMEQQLFELPDPADRTDLNRRLVTRVTARRAMQMISEECRRLFRMYFYAERNYDEISQSLGIPLGTVKSRIFRCLRRAQDLMTEDRSH